MRQVVGNPFENQTPTVSPTAQVVDTYYRPTAERSSLAGIAQTLQKFQQQAKQPMNEMTQRGIEREINEGKALYEQNRLDFGEAVKEGLIPEGASPFILKGYRVSMMNTLGMRYADELQAEMAAKKLYTSGDKTKIEGFIKDFQDQFMSTHGMDQFRPSEVAEFFGTAATKANESFRDTWLDKHIAWNRAQAYKAFEAEVASKTALLFTDGQTPEERQTALNDLSSWLEGRSASLNMDGMSNTAVLDTILSGIGIAVEQTGDTDILDVFGKTKLGTAAIASSLKVQGKLLDLENKAVRINEARRRANEKQTDAAFEAARATVMSSQFNFEADPSDENRAELVQGITTLLSTGDEKNAALALKIQDDLSKIDDGERKGGGNKTPQTEIELDEALSGATTADEARNILLNAASRGEITMTDVSSRMNNWRSNLDPMKDAPEGLNFYKTSTAEGRAVTDFVSIVKGNEFEFNNQTAANAAQARRQFIAEYTRLAAAQEEATGKHLSDLDKLDIAEKVTTRLIGLYRSEEGGSDYVYPNIPNLPKNN
jgi:hypothetical protein